MLKNELKKLLDQWRYMAEHAGHPEARDVFDICAEELEDVLERVGEERCSDE